jgi:hypothetical protein
MEKTINIELTPHPEYDNVLWMQTMIAGLLFTHVAQKYKGCFVDEKVRRDIAYDISTFMYRVLGPNHPFRIEPFFIEDTLTYKLHTQ